MVNWLAVLAAALTSMTLVSGQPSLPQRERAPPSGSTASSLRPVCDDSASLPVFGLQSRARPDRVFDQDSHHRPGPRHDRMGEYPRVDHVLRVKI
jgi:hypothetical protein